VKGKDKIDIAEKSIYKVIEVSPKGFPETITIPFHYEPVCKHLPSYLWEPVRRRNLLIPSLPDERKRILLLYNTLV
jgi:hypothetical protein